MGHAIERTAVVAGDAMKPSSRKFSQHLEVARLKTVVFPSSLKVDPPAGCDRRGGIGICESSSTPPSRLLPETADDPGVADMKIRSPTSSTDGFVVRLW
jgi:hypothetical protein